MRKASCTRVASTWLLIAHPTNRSNRTATYNDDSQRQHAYGLLMSLPMLIDTHGGFDFTATECTTWMHEAGFRETRIEAPAGHGAMVIGRK
jgi:hypothetical protein